MQTYNFSLPLIIASAMWLSSPGAIAQSSAYSPDVHELNADSLLSFDPAPELDISSGGTIEFWVSPDWTDDPGYDPTILSNAGEQGPSYIIAMLRDRDGLAIVSGETEDIVTFDFTDRALHHVAISQLDTGMVVFIDGEVVGTPDIKTSPLPSSGLWLGSIDGEGQVFDGAIAGLRFWSVDIPQDTLKKFAFSDIFGSGGEEHPDLQYLSAVSDFASGDLLITEANEPL